MVLRTLEMQDDGPCARAREQQRREHPRRAEANDHGARLRRRDVLDGVGLVVHDRGAAAAADELPFVPAHGHAHGVNIVNVVFSARIERLFADAQAGDVLRRHVQRPGGKDAQLRLVRAGGELSRPFC